MLCHALLCCAAQIEEFDAELEAMAGQKTKKGGKPPPRQVHLDESIARHRQHITRLEQMLRLLDNDAISVSQPGVQAASGAGSFVGRQGAMAGVSCLLGEAGLKELHSALAGARLIARRCPAARAACFRPRTWRT